MELSNIFSQKPKNNGISIGGGSSNKEPICPPSIG
jgi:hypothetical protein